MAAHLLRAAPPPELDVLGVTTGGVVVVVRRGSPRGWRDKGGEQVVQPRRRLLKQHPFAVGQRPALGRHAGHLARGQSPHLGGEGRQLCSANVTIRGRCAKRVSVGADSCGK